MGRWIKQVLMPILWNQRVENFLNYLSSISFSYFKGHNIFNDTTNSVTNGHYFFSYILALKAANENSGPEMCNLWSLMNAFMFMSGLFTNWIYFLYNPFK